MKSRGLVYRDVSSGNVYWVIDKKGGPRGVLADVEYAKPYDPDASLDDIRTVSLTGSDQSLQTKCAVYRVQSISWHVK